MGSAATSAARLSRINAERPSPAPRKLRPYALMAATLAPDWGSNVVGS